MNGVFVTFLLEEKHKKEFRVVKLICFTLPFGI